MEGEMTFQISPTSYIDVEFVQKAVENGEDDSTKIVKISDVNSRIFNDKCSTDTCHVTATLANGEQHSVVVKCLSRAGLKSKGLERFHKEIKMLTETLPSMEMLLQLTCPEEFRPLGPKCYSYYHGSESPPFVVLENLRQKGYSNAKPKFILEFSHCRIALKALARFHAASIAFLQQNPEELEYYCKYDLADNFRGVFEDFITGGVECLADEVIKWPGFEGYSEKLLELKNVMCDRLRETVRLKEGSLNCLIHADPTASSLMFRVSENVVTDVRLSNFQSVIFGSPVIDVLHYLYAYSNDRINLFGTKTLINEYHSTLHRTLHVLGYSDLSPSLEEFQQILSQYKFYAFYLSTSVLPFLVYDPNEEIEGDDIENTNRSLRINPRVYKGNIYKSIMECLLPEYELQGIFRIGNS
ncbi:uncharacterized protein [Anabrus simplex]